jgi:Ppx/GppA phosphatase family
LVVFDTGGGSSQFTFGRGPQVEERFSVNVGAVRYTEHFGLAGAVAPRCWAMPLPRSPPTWPASMAAPGRMPWWGWAAR